MYKVAEGRAKLENESGKARRYNRGVKTLEQLLAACRQGHEIDTSEIPPILPQSALAEASPKGLAGKLNLISTTFSP